MLEMRKLLLTSSYVHCLLVFGFCEWTSFSLWSWSHFGWLSLAAAQMRRTCVSCSWLHSSRRASWVEISARRAKRISCHSHWFLWDPLPPCFSWEQYWLEKLGLWTDAPCSSPSLQGPLGLLVLRSHGFGPSPPPSPSFPLLLTSFPPDTIFCGPLSRKKQSVLQHLQIIHKLYAQMHGVLLHTSRTWMQVLGRLWTWEFRKVSISSSIDLSSCFWPYISTPRLFFMFLAVGGERAPTENLEIKHILLQKRNKPKTKENLPLSVLFLLVFLYFQIYLHESKKFLHLFLW